MLTCFPPFEEVEAKKDAEEEQNRRKEHMLRSFLLHAENIHIDVRKLNLVSVQLGASVSSGGGLSARPTTKFCDASDFLFSFYVCLIHTDIRA
jgi:hypothetical protein